LSYESDELSDDVKRRRKQADVGKSANMVVGHEWQSVDYMVFLHFLSFCAMKVQIKHHKTQAKKLHKKVFDTTPRNMSEDPPSSRKGTPFVSMVNKKWWDEHPDMKLHTKGGDWLASFYKRLKDGEVFAEDAVYLQELDAWHMAMHPVEIDYWGELCMSTEALKAIIIDQDISISAGCNSELNLQLCPDILMQPFISFEPLHPHKPEHALSIMQILVELKDLKHLTICMHLLLTWDHHMNKR
ncbi:hypothetical protein PAXRUDRAFT_28328, partial [Paxillus rubicundulus Ve08.2h10]